jgi:hypothetical protein
MSDQPKRQPGQTASAGQSAVETAAEATERVTNAGLSLAEQFSKRIAEMQLFAMPDMDAVTTAHRRNMEALSAAYRAALEGAQAVSRRNGERWSPRTGQFGGSNKLWLWLSSGRQFLHAGCPIHLVWRYPAQSGVRAFSVVIVDPTR